MLKSGNRVPAAAKTNTSEAGRGDKRHPSGRHRVRGAVRSGGGRHAHGTTAPCSFVAGRLASTVAILSGHVDNDGAPDDEASRIRTQPYNRRGDLLGPTRSPHRFLRNHRLPSLSGRTTESIHHRRVDDPRAHGVDTDVRLRVVESRRLGQTNHAVLRGDVGPAPFETSNPSARRGVYDGAAPLARASMGFHASCTETHRAASTAASALHQA